MPNKNFENPSIKMCFSLSSLHPSTVNVDGEQQAAAQRPYNSLTKKVKKNETADSWKGDSSNEFLSSLRTNYQYLMDNNLIESCREVGYDLNISSPIQDWNNERLSIYIKELEKSFYSGPAPKTKSCSFTENPSSPKRLSLSEEVHRLNLLRHLAQLSKRLPHCQEPSVNQNYSSIYNAHYLEVKSNLRTLEQWMVQMEELLKPIYFRVNWNRREIRQKSEEHKSIHADIETNGKRIRLVLKYCKWLGDEHQPANTEHQELAQSVPLLVKKANDFEHRWQLLYIRSLEWICFIENLSAKKSRRDSDLSSSDCDEKPVHKYPRVVDDDDDDDDNDALTNTIDVDKSNYDMETSPSPVLKSDRLSFDDTANFHRSDRKGPNLATFYYRHMDTDSEQESSKKFTVETVVSSEEEWTYTTKQITAPETNVSLAERTNIEEIKALVKNVNWPVSKNKFDPENNEPIGDSCDASGEYTTEDDDQHLNSDNHSYSSRSCDTTMMQSTEIDFSLNPELIDNSSSPKIILRPKTNSKNALRPVSMSGLPQSNQKARPLTESCQLSVSESALNQISHVQVSTVNGRDSSTIDESTATQTQDCCGTSNTNSLRRRKLKHRRKSTMERKSKSGSADSLSSAINSTIYNGMVTSGSFSGSLCGTSHIDSQRVDSESEEEMTKESKRPFIRRRPIKTPVFRLGEFGAVTPREKRFPITTQLPSGTTTDLSSGQAWDSYQEKYLSEPYSEDPPDPESVRQLLDFGDDYRKYIDSQSDCASSMGRPGCFDDETFEQDSSESICSLIHRSRSQLNYVERVFLKSITCANNHLTVAEIDHLKQWCRETEYCLRFSLDGIKDSSDFVPTKDIAELERMVKKCERLEQDIARQDKIQLLKADIAAIRSRLLSFARSDRLDSNLQNKSELQAFILSAKTELLNLETYWNGRNVVNITEEINRHFNELNDTVSNHVKKELTDLYSIYANARQRLECEISRYQSALNTWVECDKQLMEVEMKFKGFGDDDGTGRNQRVGWFGSVSDSGLSDSGSEHELNEQEKRLDNLKQMAKNLTSVLTPESDAILSILSRIESNEKQLKELQQTCKDLIGRTEIYTDENKMDGNESSVETNVVDSTATEETKSSFTKIKSNSTLLWRTIRIAVPFYVFVMVLCSLGWLEPQCCDFQNNYKWSLALGLRYLNGPPPT